MIAVGRPVADRGLITIHGRCTFRDHLIAVHASRFVGLQMPSTARYGGCHLPGDPESSTASCIPAGGFGAVPLGPRIRGRAAAPSPIRRGLAPRSPGWDEADWGSAGLARFCRATGRAHALASRDLLCLLVSGGGRISSRGGRAPSVRPRCVEGPRVPVRVPVGATPRGSRRADTGP